MDAKVKEEPIIVTSKLLKGEYKYRRITSTIKERDGKIVFQNDNVLVPEHWSQTASDILVQKYFRKAGIPLLSVAIAEAGVYPEFYRSEAVDNPEIPYAEQFTGESSAHQVFHRIAGAWTYWGLKSGYFTTKKDAISFYNDCYYALYHQLAAPNSPQWFNTGIHWAYGIKSDASTSPLYHYDLDAKKVVKSQYSYVNPQVHACFIQSIDDHLISQGGIMDLAIREATVFKYGSGSGSNFSNLRALGENLSSGGVSSGLMSFLKIGDTSAGAIKSGGTTRRAAKMVVVDIDHPEIENFISWKMREENKVAALVAGSMLNKRLIKAIVDAQTSDSLDLAAAEAYNAGVPGGLITRALEANKNGYDLNIEEYDADWQGDAYGTVSGQNANNSISIPNAFMDAVDQDSDWNLTARKDGRVMKTVKARKLWNDMNMAAWASADPAVQYVDTMNDWNTCINDEKIRATNPCSEYVWFDDTACNLASLNIVAIWNHSGGNFGVFADHIAYYSRLFTTVLDISIQMAQFVSEKIAIKTHEYRTTGLGYANIGAFIMMRGFAYGSHEANNLVAGITSLMTANAYWQSHKLATRLAPFPAYERNKEPFTNVMSKHSDATELYLGKSEGGLSEQLLIDAKLMWRDVIKATSFRNAQVTVIAPTGTIGLVMDCDTTGIEPDFSLVKHKKLAGGGYMKLTNQAVAPALRNLGYGNNVVDSVVEFISGAKHLPTFNSLNPLTGETFTAEELMEYITIEDLENFGVNTDVLNSIDTDKHYSLLSIIEQIERESKIDLSVLKVADEKYSNTNNFIFGYGNIDDCPLVSDMHKPIFACAVSAKPNGVVIQPLDHLKAMAAAQPFVSGAISKTINMPADATVRDIADINIWAYKNGLKAVSIYRDGSKLSQPLMSSVAEKLTKIINNKIKTDVAQVVAEVPVVEKPVDTGKVMQTMVNIIGGRGVRRKMPSKASGYRQKVHIGGHGLYVHTGDYEDGTIGEIFIDMHKEGAAFRSIMNSFAIAISIGLQYGVPLEEFCDAFIGSRFEPAGPVRGHDNIKMTKSLIDYIFRDLAFNYLGNQDVVEVKPQENQTEVVAELTTSETTTIVEKTADSSTVITHKKASAFKSYGSSNIYSGETCTACGSTKMKPTGTCSTCEDCGTTSGCS